MKVVDMHCDTISALYNSGNIGEGIAEDIAAGNKKGWNLRKNPLHIDLERMKKGNYLAQNFGLFVNLEGEKDPLEHCLKLVDLFYKEIEDNVDMIGQALNYNDIIENERQGKMSALLTIEEGGVAKGSLAHLRNFYRLGVRMLTLTWNYENEIGYSHKSGKLQDKDQDKEKVIYGLKPFGIDFIKEMESLGMIIDVSHLSDGGVYDVLKHTDTPFVASHSNARAICSHSRNLPDELIRQMANRGCVIGVNFYPPFLEEMGSEEENTGSISAIVKHINHLINVGGSQCIGLGSDFDGIPGHDELKDASYLPRLAQSLEDAGLTYRTIENIFYKNVLNIYKEVLK